MKFTSLLQLLSLSLLASLLASCSTSGGMDGKKPDFPEPKQTYYLQGESPEWNTLSQLKEDLNGIATLSGKVLDFKGNGLSGKKLKKPSNSQNEKSIPLRIRIPSLHVKNAVISDVPGGLVLFADGIKFTSCIFTNIGEDAISNQMDKSKNFQLTGCKFYGKRSNDKLGQFNDGRGLIVTGCYFTGGITALRIQDKDAKSRKGTAKVYNNIFESVDTAINASPDITVETKGNTYKDVRHEFVGDGKLKQL